MYRAGEERSNDKCCGESIGLSSDFRLFIDKL